MAGHGSPRNRQMNGFWVNPEQKKILGCLRQRADIGLLPKLVQMDGQPRSGTLPIMEVLGHIQFHIDIVSAGLMVFTFRVHLLIIQV